MTAVVKSWLAWLLEAAHSHDERAAESGGHQWWSTHGPARTHELVSGITWLSWGIGIEAWSADRTNSGVTLVAGPAWLSYHVTMAVT